MLPTVPNVIGRCQVDGMALATGVAAEQTRSERLAVARHLPGQDSRKPQFRRHPTAQADSRQERSSAFGTKRSQVQILSPRRRSEALSLLGEGLF